MVSTRPCLGLALGLLAACSTPVSNGGPEVVEDVQSDADGRDVPVPAVNGTFVVILPAGTATLVQVNGLVLDGPSIPTFLFAPILEEGDCRVLQRAAPPFCDPGCTGGALCVEVDGINRCVTYPQGLDVGTVTMHGVATIDGQTTLVLASAKGQMYLPADDATVADPPFAEGDPLLLETSGAGPWAFTIPAQGIRPLELLSPGTVTLEPDVPVAFTWTPPADPAATRIEVEIAIATHGSNASRLTCEGPDTGSMTIAGSLVRRLIEIEVTGHPAFRVTRREARSVQVGGGRVTWDLSHTAELPLGVAGYVFCDGLTPCPGGRVCDARHICL